MMMEDGEKQESWRARDPCCNRGLMSPAQRCSSGIIGNRGIAKWHNDPNPQRPSQRGIHRWAEETSKFGQFELIFTHTCRATGCADSSCRLCEMNPQRECGERILNMQYYVGCEFVTRCNQPLVLCMVDKVKGTIHKANAAVEFYVVSETRFHAAFNGRIPDCSQDLASCVPCYGQKDEPQLALKGTVKRFQATMQDGQLLLPRNLFVTKSSRVVFGNGQQGEKYYKIVACICKEGPNCPPAHTIQCAVSDIFQVASYRSKCNAKKEILETSDALFHIVNISKKRQIRIERFPKELGLTRSGDPFVIQTVADFQVFAALVNEHPLLHRKVLHQLAISRDDWQAACRQADCALRPDSVFRSWTPSLPDLRVHMVLYDCHKAQIMFEKGPIGFVHNGKVSWSFTWGSATLEQFENLHIQAVSDWFKPNHPRWAIYDPDSSKGFQLCDRDPLIWEAKEDAMEIDSGSLEDGGSSVSTAGQEVSSGKYCSLHGTFTLSTPQKCAQKADNLSEEMVFQDTGDHHIHSNRGHRDDGHYVNEYYELPDDRGKHLLHTDSEVDELCAQLPFGLDEQYSEGTVYSCTTDQSMVDISHPISRTLSAVSDANGPYYETMPGVHPSVQTLEDCSMAVEDTELHDRGALNIELLKIIERLHKF